MGKYLNQAASPRVLNHAWQYLRHDRGLWCRGLATPEMQRHLIQPVGELSQQLLNGQYHPEAMNCFEIDKADGKKRLICAAAVRDKLVQRAILSVIEPLGEAIFHEASCGFRPKYNLDMALAKVREWVRKGYIWLGDADIKACFDTIPYQQVLKRLYKMCGDKQLIAVVKDSIESMPGQFRLNGQSRGLPQGLD